MKHGFMMGTAAFILVVGTALAHAQTSTYSTTTTTTAPMVAAPVIADPVPVVPPPEGTLSTTETQKSIDANGDEVDSTKTTYGSMDGAASDSTTTTSIAPPPVETTVTKKVITTSTSD